MRCGGQRNNAGGGASAGVGREKREFQYFYDEHSITIDIEGSYTTNSTYHTNLNTLTSNILNNKEIDYGFYNVSYGEYPNRVYTIGLYRGDIKQEQCRTCLNQSKANLTAVCPNRKVAIGWYNDELCMLRYLNRRIFDWMDNGPAYYKKSDKNAMDLNEFNTKLNDLLNGLKSKASSGDSRLKEDCDNCIAQSIERISKDCCKDSMRGKSHTSVLVIAITVPIVAVIMFMFIFIRSRYLRKRKQRKSNSKDDNTEDMKIVESLQFNLECIRDATNDFSDANKLGQGGFGVVYKGILTNGQEIAVKRLARSSVLLLAKLQHRNLVSLLGFCLEGRERLLVYEFVPNKSLDYFIFCRIIGGIARGLVYLHEDSRLRIIHRNLKAANILLDEKMNPKILDFVTVKLFATSQTHSNTNRIVETYFGILVLEIVSGKKSSGNCQSENPETLMNFAWRNWKDGTISNIVDTTLRNSSQNEIMRFIRIALLCVQANEADRPTTATVLLMLYNHSITFAVPSKPAFLLNTGSNTSTKGPAHESVNEASITDPYPR
ncbi:hypothetical protein AHAS_Ahas02G0120300 [Arachis hypogaea]